ncbi:MAG: ATPase [Spirochaetae bacterium HGW-Spirochaetae-3]|jgi:V/A-type H+-transporting ATPase subunit K|nr:MAG: ATPase [Spirochaetae bacterium HGW-Spirochaetae-3]
MEDVKKRFAGRVGTSLVTVVALMAIFGAVAAVSASAQDATRAAVSISPEQAKVQQFGLIAAAIAFGMGAIGAGIAIANVGAAAMGAIGERPEIASQALIFIALAEGLVVFGFITALMILGKF